jgi:hypothetical protein
MGTTGASSIRRPQRQDLALEVAVCLVAEGDVDRAGAHATEVTT